MHMDVLTDVYPRTTYLQYLQRPEECRRFPGNGVTDGCGSPCE